MGAVADQSTSEPRVNCWHGARWAKTVTGGAVGGAQAEGDARWPPPLPPIYQATARVQMAAAGTRGMRTETFAVHVHRGGGFPLCGRLL